MTLPTHPSRVLRELLDTAAELNACGLVSRADLAPLQALGAAPPASCAAGEPAPRNSTAATPRPGKTAQG